MADFKVINTQEEFDERIKERIERAEKKAKEGFDGWISPDSLKEEMKKAEEKYKGEIEALKKTHAEELKKYEGFDEKFAEQETKIKTLTVSNLKNKVAMEKKLPLDAVDFLQGEDEASIIESAEKLSKLSGNHTQGYTRNTEKDEGNPIDRELREVLNKLPKAGN